MTRLTQWKENFMFWKREDLDQTYVTIVISNLKLVVKKTEKEIDAHIRYYIYTYF